MVMSLSHSFSRIGLILHHKWCHMYLYEHPSHTLNLGPHILPTAASWPTLWLRGKDAISTLSLIPRQTSIRDLYKSQKNSWSYWGKNSRDPST